ncbi:MAG: DUF488 family protein [Polyangia bacterium]
MGFAASIRTVGHSTRTIAELIELCRVHGVARIADVRRFPGSRRNPQFGREPLAAALADAGIDYVWLPALGSRRRRSPDAPPSAWRIPAFAAYADYMWTDEFKLAIRDLLTSSAALMTAVMCAEAVPYRCHRRLISDWAELHAVAVEHILSAKRRERHRLTAFAERDGDDVVYRAESARSPQLDLPL